MSLAELQSVLTAQCQRHPVKSLRVFGSVARGDNKKGSDLDLLVQFEDLSATDYARHYFGLLHDIEDAVGCEVDLLTPYSVKRNSLKRNIQEEGIVVYEA
jgi:predicted nucleotidyltransferase